MIFSHSFCCKVCPRRYSKWLISLQDTSDRSSEVAIVLGHGQILHKHSLPLLGGYPHLFFCWSSSDILLSPDWILGLALSYASCTYETRYWAWPPPMQLEHRASIGPHNSPSKSCFSAPREKRRILILSSDLPYDLVLLGQVVITRVCLLMTRPWLFSAQGMPSFNFGNSFVSHIQRLDDNPTAVKFFGNLSRRIPLLIFAPL